MNKSSTEWKCCGHKIEDYDCPCFHEGWITGNSEPPLKEQEKWDTATQGDELSGNPGKLGDNSKHLAAEIEANRASINAGQSQLPATGVDMLLDTKEKSLDMSGDEQIQTKGESIHPEKDRYKDQIADILANRYGLILLPAVDELAALFPVEGESKEKHLTGDDSMKEQISKILIKWNMPTRQVAINEIVALFQSQESKTLERVREKVADLKFFPVKSGKGILGYTMLVEIKDVLAILEAEKGKK